MSERVTCTRCGRWVTWNGVALPPDCACAKIQLDSEQQMAGVDFDALERLFAMGVTDVTYHANGSLASITRGPAVSSPDEKDQHDQPAASPKRVSATGGLVRRAVESDS